MKFRKINDKTINCIITQDDLKKHGINLDDLFDRKKKAVEFIKAIILKAANSVNLNMKNEYTSMRLSVLPDQSVSLTISQDPLESDKIHREKDLAAGAVDSGNKKAAKGGQPRRKEDAAKPAQAGIENGMWGGTPQGTYLFQFSSLMEMGRCSSILASQPGIGSSVYLDRNSGIYYLILEKEEDAGENYDRSVLSVNEFGRMVTCSEMTLAYLKEHSDCILKDHAVQQIAELYS